MPVGFIVEDTFYFEIGHGEMLHSFFSTICYRLESNVWGSRFPILMRKLYSDKVEPNDLSLLKLEVKKIQNELSKLNPNKSILNIENISLKAPWENNFSKKIKNLDNYFTTSDSITFTEMLFKAIKMAEDGSYHIKIKKINI